MNFRIYESYFHLPEQRNAGIKRCGNIVWTQCEVHSNDSDKFYIFNTYTLYFF